MTINSRVEYERVRCHSEAVRGRSVTFRYLQKLLAILFVYVVRRGRLILVGSPAISSNLAARFLVVRQLQFTFLCAGLEACHFGKAGHFAQTSFGVLNVYN